MGERINYTNAGSSSNWELNMAKIVPKEEVSDMEFPSETMPARRIEDCAASSSGTNLRSSFLSMGFSPSLVDRVIREKGEDDTELLLETLFAYSAMQNSNLESSDSVFDDIKDDDSPPDFAADSHPKALHKSNSESSDSLDSLFGDKDDSRKPQDAVDIHPKDEPDIIDEFSEDKRASLLSMNFSVKEVSFALETLGKDAPTSELVDFIFAAQMAENVEDLEDAAHKDKKINEETNTEKLYGTMDQTLRLLEMGFSESQVSLAIEKFGSEVPISELAHYIFVGDVSDSYANSSGSTHWKRHSSDSFIVKKEEYIQDDYCQPNNFSLEGNRKGKRPKQEYLDGSSSCIGPVWPESRKSGPKINNHQMLSRDASEKLGDFEIARPFKSNPSKSVSKVVFEPPYFFYGNVANLSQDSYEKMSQFFYSIEPEFINTQFFSALSRREGYLHNLPTANRSHVFPKSPMTMEDAIPNTKRYWPSWDTRKQLSCISSETYGTHELCERLGKILIRSHGVLSVEQQRDLLHQCRVSNLVWAGKYKLAPLEPEHLEHILGYPVHHTQSADWGMIERLQSLKNCFQTDTLGYHISVLKSMFPEGMIVLSIFSGIGGAEVALHRLGIRLKAVVSVETSETMRRILKRWWQNTEQKGELVQIEDIQRLTTKRLDGLASQFGGFDLVISQNPCTQSSKSSKIVADTDTVAGFDFSMFYEFVRVVQRVRHMGTKS